MSDPKLSELQSDHKHWLQEIERWEGYLRMWTDQQREMADEFRRFLDRIEAYGRELESHATSLRQHQKEIVACERAMAERHGESDEVTSELRQCYTQGAEHHRELRHAHERLQEQYHAFMAQLAMSRHAPKEG